MIFIGNQYETPGGATLCEAWPGAMAAYVKHLRGKRKIEKGTRYKHAGRTQFNTARCRRVGPGVYQKPIAEVNPGAAKLPPK